MVQNQNAIRGLGNRPWQSMESIDPSGGDVVLDPPARALYVGTGGNVAILCQDDTTAVTLVNVPDAGVIRAMIQQVKQTGTTASDIVACY